MKRLGIIVLVLALLVGCQNQTENNSVKEPVLTPDETIVAEDVDRGPIVIQSLEDIDSAIELMTLEEKAGQLIQAERAGISLAEIKAYNIGSILSGGGSAPSKNTPEGWVTYYNRIQKVMQTSTSGIPVIYGIDAVHGHNNVMDTIIYPHNIGLGASGDADLVYEIAKATARDIKATGLDWNFAPAVSIVQDIRWGRSYESYSEGVDLVAELGTSYVKGLQDEGVMATTKHFIGDGYTSFGTGEGTNLIDRGDVTVAMDQLLSLYLPAYEAAIEADTKTIMASFNSVDGVKLHEHKYLLTDVLRGELGFQGLVVSDWEAIHALGGTLEDQVAKAINAGVDMLMQPYNWKAVHEAIVANVSLGKISENRLDEAVSRVLTLKYEAGLFTNDVMKTVGQLESDSGLARTAVSKSMVLLKNDGILPLSKTQKIAIIGPAADNVGVQCGGWTLSWQGEMAPDLFNGTSLKAAIEMVVGPGQLVEPEDADVILLAIGERTYTEMMGDTADLSLDGPLALEGNLEAVQEALSYKVPVVTVMISGRPMLVDEYLNDWDAFVMAWLPGTAGLGMTDVLFGDVAFSGKLPVTWPKTNNQASDTINMDNYEDQDHQFKVGHGLTE